MTIKKALLFLSWSISFVSIGVILTNINIHYLSKRIIILENNLFYPKALK
jgi:hypothetical protein